MVIDAGEGAAADASDIPDGGGAPRSDVVWAVGGGGLIVGRSGAGWAVHKSGTTADLIDVWVAGPDAAWAVGRSGTLLRWDGAKWQPQTAKTTETLRSVRGSGRDDVWAVGGSTTAVALHWDGATWTRYAPLLPSIMSGLMLVQVGAAGVWACGHAVGGMSGRAVTLRYQAGAWLLDQRHGSATATCAGLVGVGTELFLGLNEPTASGLGASIRRWNGTGWSVAAIEAQTRLVGMSAGWVAATRIGSSVLLRWSGSAYQEFASATVQTGAIWAAGADVLGIERDKVLLWNGMNDWTVQYTAPRSLLAVSAHGSGAPLSAAR